MYIYESGYGTPPVISGNTIFNISADNNTAVATTSAGIMATNFDGVISGNKIYNIANESTIASEVTPAIAAGIFFRFTGGSNAAINNMISLGSGQDNNAA